MLRKLLCLVVVGSLVAVLGCTKEPEKTTASLKNRMVKPEGVK